MNRAGFSVVCIVCNCEMDFQGKVKLSKMRVQPLYGDHFPVNVLEAASDIDTLGCVDATSRFDEVKCSDVIGFC